MKKVIIVVAHPNENSYNHAIANLAKNLLIKNGYEVIFHDLYKEKFDPIFTSVELNIDYKIPDDILSYCNEIQEADGLIVVHPNWYGQLPAILKGWVDRVFAPNVVHSLPPEGSIITDGLLTSMTAIALVTSDVPLERELRVFKNPLETIWKNCIFGFSEVKDSTFKLITSVFHSSQDEREKWLNEIEELINLKFPTQKNTIKLKD